MALSLLVRTSPVLLRDRRAVGAIPLPVPSESAVPGISNISLALKVLGRLGAFTVEGFRKESIKMTVKRIVLILTA
jgi:hypothetical protein